MSYADNDHKKAYVITYKELIFTFLVFCVILFVLYPKDLLKEQILSEKSNYDLSILYLKNLLKHSPEDESLMLILAEQSLRTGNKDLSMRLLELLLKSSNKEHRNRATLLSYDLQKEYYFNMKEKKRKVKQKKMLRDLFIEIYIFKMYDKNDIEKWYNESVFVNVGRATYFFIPKMLEKDPENIIFLEQAYYLAKKYKDIANAFKYVRLLKRYDRVQANKWKTDEYYMYISFEAYEQAEKLLRKYSDNSIEWKERLATFYLMTKKYKKSSEVYSELFNLELDYEERKNYFYKSIQALQSGNLLKETAKKVHKYENIYLQDRDVRKFMLKVYIATGNLNDAANLSKKILKKELK